MNIDINYSYVQYGTNVNVIGMNWQNFGKGDWYDKREMSYHDACLKTKSEVWEEIYNQYPHLKGTEVNYTEYGDIPTIDVNAM